MTRDELHELLTEHPTVPLLTAFAAIEVSETAGRKAYARGDLPFRVIRVGTALRVPSVDLEVLLLTSNNSEARPATGLAVALTDESVKGTRNDDGPTTSLALRSIS